jgi:hypothetical protein
MAGKEQEALYLLVLDAIVGVLSTVSRFGES